MEWKPSKKHFEYLRSREYIHLPFNMDYCIEKNDDELFICFQETSGPGEQKSADDWAANLDFFPNTFDIFPGSKIKAHEGLAKQYLGIRKEILDLLYSGKFKRIYVGGFSQGGGITTGCVQDIGFHIDQDRLPVEVFGISYEAPRFFGIRMGSLIKKSLEHRLLTVKGHWDPVVHVPCKIMPTFFTFRWRPFKLKLCFPRLSFWRDYGKVIWIGKFWRLWPLQHIPEQVSQNLLKKFKE